MLPFEAAQLLISTRIVNTPFRFVLVVCCGSSVQRAIEDR